MDYKIIVKTEKGKAGFSVIDGDLFKRITSDMNGMYIMTFTPLSKDSTEKQYQYFAGYLVPILESAYQKENKEVLSIQQIASIMRERGAHIPHKINTIEDFNQCSLKDLSSLIKIIIHLLNEFYHIKI